MALTTYSELQDSIADFLNRTDVTSQIKDFIRLAEVGMERDIRHWQMEKRATANLDTQYSLLPNDFREPIRLIIPTSEVHTLEQAGPFEISQRRAEASDTSGRPELYAILDGSIEVFPTPDTTYTLEILYYKNIDALSATTTNNWLLTNYPDAYLYGSLIHSAPFLAEDQRIQPWSALYQRAIDAINAESDRGKTSGSGRRIKIRSYG